MSNTFEEMLNEDIMGAFRKIGGAIKAKSQRAGEEARMKFWAKLGDAKAEGELDFNYMMDDLISEYEYFCGTMQYEQTAKSFIDFIGVLGGKSEFDTKTLMTMMGGRTDPMKMNSPNEEVIDEIFQKISNKEIQGQDIPDAIMQIEKLSRNKEDKALIFEYMRLVVQNMPEMLERAEWARLLPFVDRYISDQELNKVFTVVAKNMLRSRAVQEYTNEEGAKGGKSNDPQDGGDDGKAPLVEVDYDKPLQMPEVENQKERTRTELQKPFDDLRFHRTFRENMFIRGEQTTQAKVVTMTAGNAANRLPIAAHIFAYIATYNGFSQNDVAQGIANAAKDAGYERYTFALALGAYKYLRAGGDIRYVNAQFEHFMKSQENNAAFLSGVMNYAALVVPRSKEAQEEKEQAAQ